jgi:excisionase family DNA binding protein
MQNLLLTSIPLETIEERFSNVVDQKFQTLLTALQQQQSTKDQKEYLTRKEAAQLLSISLVTLSEWQKQGIVKGYRIASRIRFKRQELETSLSQIKTGGRAA